VKLKEVTVGKKKKHTLLLTFSLLTFELCINYSFAIRYFVL
jgi:hypothetical protein